MLPAFSHNNLIWGQPTDVPSTESNEQKNIITRCVSMFHAGLCTRRGTAGVSARNISRRRGKVGRGRKHLLRGLR